MNLHLIMMMVLNALELAASSTLFCHKLEKRSYYLFRCAICVIAAVVYIFCFPLEKLNYFIIHIPLIVLSFLYIGFCYELTMVQTIFLGTVSYTIKHLASLLVSLITVFFPDRLNHFDNADTSRLTYAFIIILDIVVFLLAYVFLEKKMGRAEVRNNATVPMAVLGVFVLIINQFWSVGLFIMGGEYLTTYNAAIEYVWNSLLCIMVLAVQLNLLTISRKENELEIVNKLIAEREQQYRISKSTMDAINRKCHDLKYQIAALSSGYASQKDMDDAMELVDSFDTTVHTGNETLDIIFTEKNYYCQKHDITFTLMIDGKLLDFMDPAEQYVMFGNMVDNAINAVRKIENHSDRYIYINIHAENKLVLIQTENRYEGTIEFKDGIPKTTSDDDFNHGYGVSSIKLIAEKYNGSMHASAEDGIFLLNVVIPME